MTSSFGHWITKERQGENGTGNGFRPNRTLHLTGGVEARIGDRRVDAKRANTSSSEGDAMTVQVATDDSRIISYRTLRKVIGIIGFLLPIVLILGKIYYFQDPGIQNSISSYYYTDMRDVLVGSLCATGAFLLSYKGYDAPVGSRLRRLLGRSTDFRASSVAGIGAIGVALFPTQSNSATLEQLIGNKSYAGVHVISAAVFFISLAYILIWRFTDHGPPNNQPSSHVEQCIDDRSRKRCNVIYVVCGCTILLSIALIGAGWLRMFVWQHSVLVLETVAIWAFSIAWFLKGSDRLKRAVGSV
jgi:hypothetical protein